MPPSTFLTKTKMHSWVKAAKGSPGLPASPAPVAYDASAPQHTRRHVNIPASRTTQSAATAPQPTPPATQLATQDASPPRSRAPIVNANSQRAAAANSARIPIPSSRSGHAREASLNLPSRNRAISAEPLQASGRTPAFWDQSTIDGSQFSDTASNMESSAPFGHRQVPVQVPDVRYEQPSIPPRHHRPAPAMSEPPDQPPPFVVGPDGLINVIRNGNGLTRSASTPDARSPRSGFKVAPSETGRDPHSDGSYSSPEKTPSAKRLNHAKNMVLRTVADSYTERGNYPHREVAIKSPKKPKIYVNPVEDQPEEMHPEAIVPPLRLDTTDHFAQRSTIFADTDTPMVSHQDESETASVERQPTPKPAAVPLPKAKQQTNRQVHSRNSKGKNGGLRESALPRSVSEKHNQASRKRSLELDYDDAALGNMDYAALKQEEFDFDPAQAEARSAVGPPQGTLPEKLGHFFTKDEASQADFFTKMDVQDWEESGDWFLERFGDIMNKFKAARKAKREVVATFENEIAEREEAVRSKVNGIAQTLSDLKAEGEGMILNRDLD